MHSLFFLETIFPNTILAADFCMHGCKRPSWQMPQGELGVHVPFMISLQGTWSAQPLDLRV